MNFYTCVKGALTIPQTLCLHIISLMGTVLLQVLISCFWGYESDSSLLNSEHKICTFKRLGCRCKNMHSWILFVGVGCPLLGCDHRVFERVDGTTSNTNNYHYGGKCKEEIYFSSNSIFWLLIFVGLDRWSVAVCRKMRVNDINNLRDLPSILIPCFHLGIS